MNLYENREDYLNCIKILGIEDQGANYIPLYKIELFVGKCFYGTEICHEVSQ